MNGKVLVVQLGRTGMSFVRFFASRGYEVEIVDSRPQPPSQAELDDEYPDLTVRRIDSYQELGGQAAGYDRILVSPGVAPSRLPREIGLQGDLDCFVEEFAARFPDAGERPKLVAVTGTNGKSTVVTLVVGMLQAGGASAEAVGNIGNPILDAVRKWNKEGWPDFVVAELSSFQLASLGRHLPADISCVVNLAPDHLDWHVDETSYIEAKLRIYQGAKVGVFYRGDSHGTRGALDAGRQVGFGGSKHESGEWSVVGDKVEKPGSTHPAVPVQQLEMAGIMPLSACAALTIAAEAAPQQDPDAHLQWLASARGLPHRLQHIGEADGIEYVDDSKATNVLAACSALRAVKTPCVLIAGGDGKGQDFSLLAAELPDRVAAVVLLGVDTAALAAAVDGLVPVVRAEGMEQAVEMATEQARRTKARTVLLSPACSSLDQYPSYAERGQAFQEQVARLGGKGGGDAPA